MTRFPRTALLLVFTIVIGTSVWNVAVAQEEGFRPPVAREEIQQFAPPQVVPLAAPQVASANDSIVLNVWSLTIAESAEDEDADALARAAADALHEKAAVATGSFGSDDSVRSLIADLRLTGRLRKSSEVRLAALSGEKTTCQTGVDQPRVTGTNQSAQGIMMNSVTFRKMGTLIEAEPVAEADGSIRIRFAYESSFIENGAEVPLTEGENGRGLMADSIGQTQIRTVVRLKNGEAILLWTDAKHEAPTETDAQPEKTDEQTNDKSTQDSGERRMIILSAAIVD